MAYSQSLSLCPRIKGNRLKDTSGVQFRAGVCRLLVAWRSPIKVLIFHLLPSNTHMDGKYVSACQQAQIANYCQLQIRTFIILTVKSKYCKTVKLSCQNNCKIEEGL